MDIKKLIELDEGLKIFDNKYRVLICVLLYKAHPMNFNSILKELNIESGKLSHHINMLVELGFLDKEKVEEGYRGESSYSLTKLGNDSIEKLSEFSLKDEPMVIAPKMDDLTWHDRVRWKKRAIFNNPVIRAYIKKANKIWVETPQQPELLAKLKNLLVNNGSLMYLKGASFTGKSSTIYDFLKSEDALGDKRSGYGYKNGIVNLLSSIEADPFAFYYVTLSCILHSRDEYMPDILDKEWTTDELRNEVFKELDKEGLRLFIIDDINYLSNAKEKNIKVVLNLAKELVSRYNASLLIIDLEEDNYQSPFINMVEDFDIFTLNKLDKEETTMMLNLIEEQYDMKLIANLENVVDSVFRTSEGRIGRIDRIIRDLGADMLRNGKKELTNEFVHKQNSDWYHRKDKQDCSICGYKRSG